MTYYPGDGDAQDVWSKAIWKEESESRSDAIEKKRIAQKRQESIRKEQRQTRANAIEKIQKELRYSDKGAAIFYNVHLKTIKMYQEQLGLTASAALAMVIENEQNQQQNVVVTLNANVIGEKLTPLSERGIELPDNIQSILDNTTKAGESFLVSSISNNELRILSQETGVEYATVKIGNRYCVIRGEETYTNIPETILSEMKKNGGELKAHCHPFIGDYMPSEEDKKALEMIETITGQTESEIISVDGIRVIFNKHGIIRIETSTDDTGLSEKDKNELIMLFSKE